MRRVLVEIVVDPYDVDAAADVLWTSGATAVEERTAADGATLLVGDADPALAGHVAAGRWPVSWTTVDAGAGLDGWRRFARAERAGERIVVRPPWMAYDAADHELVLEIDPGHAFGSGSHPTTRLALADLDAVAGDVAGGVVLDVGCGSGVLAVAAARLGARRVVAVDLDEVALAATAANARRNGVSARVDVSETPVGSLTGRFDVVLANITRDVAIELAPDVQARTRPGGWVIVAGFLAGDTARVAAAYRGCDVVARSEEDGWGALRLRLRLGRSVDAQQPG